jgi:hypothetical protein
MPDDYACKAARRKASNIVTKTRVIQGPEFWLLTPSLDTIGGRARWEPSCGTRQRCKRLHGARR